MALERPETDDPAHLTSTVSTDNLLIAESSNELNRHTSSLKLGNTSSSALLETPQQPLGGKTIPCYPGGRSCTARCGGLSLALSEFTARSKEVASMNSGSSVHSLPSIVKEDVVAPEGSSRGIGNIIALPLSRKSEESSGHFLSGYLFCNQEVYQIDSVKAEDSKSELRSSHMEVPTRNSGNPHISYAYSMTEGAGRTLKGRDLVRFRNHVLRLTGFLED